MLFLLPIKTFSISHWSLVFPIASYANAWSVLSRDLRNNGMRGWAATFTMIATLLWILCAVMTTYHGFWKGSLFSAPGLEDWLDEKGEQDDSSKGGWKGTYDLPDPSEQGEKDEESGQANGHENGNGNGNDARRRS